MDYALLLVVVGCLAVGVTGAVVKTWSLHRRTYSLEDRMGVLEGVQQREVKIRAAQARTPKSQDDQILLEHMKNVAPVKKKNWWEKPQKVG